MGYDLLGLASEGEKENSFCNSIWGWYPLWNYVCKTCSDFLTDIDMEQGNWNNGYLLNEWQSAKIASRLFDLIESGAVHEEAVEFNKKRSNMPFETCSVCNGTGIREDKNYTGKCNACDGKGQREPSEAWYDFEEDNVSEFAEFCCDSGGFYIC